MKTVTVRVPASSANLGPGFDSFAAALDIWLELEVTEAGEFSVTTDLAVPTDRTNLVVSSFERIHTADGLRFAISSDIPLSGGLGSSAAAIIAGILAAKEISGEQPDVLRFACGVEGHPDNVSAALLGGVVVVSHLNPHRFDPPADIAAILVVPHEAVSTREARAALPAQVPLADAADNVAHGALLMLGLQSGDPSLICRGLRDHLHQPYRAKLYPRSAALLAKARELGALGATISGAGPTVLFWVTANQLNSVTKHLTALTTDWAQVMPTHFTPSGAHVTPSPEPSAQPPERKR
jgi:homoserine kinase